MTQTFRALLLEQGADRAVTASLQELPDERLPAGDVLVRVEYSTLNYKDGLILKNGGGLVKTWPHVGGIDLAGIVEKSDNAGFKVGDRVVLDGFRVGELHWGGYAQKARVRGEWLVALPAALSTAQAMAIGTAGYTAMLCVLALEKHGIKPDAGEILINGAAGGVGSVAIAILAKLGYTVTAATGRAEEADYLKDLGATTVIARSEITDQPDRPLLSERFAGVVDTVGSKMLAKSLAMTRYGGAVAACGLAGGADLPTTVLPFILRGITLYGIDSVMLPLPPRIEAWARLARDLPLDKLEAMTRTVGLGDVPGYGAQILKGQVRGRLVVDVNR